MMKKLLLIVVVLLSISFTQAQNVVVPIIDVKIGGLLGGVKNGKYLNAETTIKSMKAQENYTLYFFDGTIARLLKVKKPAPFCPDGFYNLDFSDREESFFDKGGTALGDGFKWNPMPRKTSQISLENAEYKKVIGDFLRTKGISNPVVKLTQAVRIDLEGDGQEEVLLTATHFAPYTEKDGKKSFDEYSVVILRKIIDGKPQTIALTSEIALNNRYDFDGYILTVSSILDLNGNGKMEIVIVLNGDESNGAKVFEMIGSKAVDVKALSVENGGECY